jgi:hypothetical protein
LAPSFSAVAPASSAASIKPLTIDGWATLSDSVKPRKPVGGASDSRSRTELSMPKASL